MNSQPQLQTANASRFRLLGVPIASTTMLGAIRIVASWVEEHHRGRMVTFTTVHMLVEAAKNPNYFQILDECDLNCPDGMPLVWFGRRRANPGTQRVCGPEFMPAFCEATADRKLRHFFYGGAEGVAEMAALKLKDRSPGLVIAGTYSPPFRPLTPEEDEEVVRMINSTKPDVIWVGLGCPKQENWAAQHRDRLDASVLLAVGLAFDIAAGLKKRAPKILRVTSLEWLFRLFQEPRRLWKRYLVYNSIFLYRVLTERPHPLD